MSIVDIPLEGPPPDIDYIDDDGNLTTEALRNDAPQLWESSTSPEFDQELTAFLNELNADFPPQVGTAVEAALTPIKISIDDGTITPAQGEQFLRWLNYNKGVTSIVNDSATTSTMTGYLSSWIIEQSGLAPTTTTTTPAPVPTVITPVQPAAPLVPNPPPTAPLPTPTVGQQVTTKTVIEVVPQQVQSTGPTGPTAGEVQAAIGVAFTDAMRAQAAAVDAMLPGLKPGQVPQALDQLNQATHVLENQLDVLRATTTGHAKASLSTQITALQGAVRALQATAATLTAQMAETTSSRLSEDLGVVKTHQLADEADIGSLRQAITTLAPMALATTLGAGVSALQRQMDLVVPSPMDTRINQVSTVADDAATAAKDSQDCCDDAHTQLGEDESALGGKSLLPNLGKLAGLAFGLAWLAGLVDSLVAIVDLPNTIFNTVYAGEKIAGWAESAVTKAVVDTSWADTVHG
jgi:hypothetical protein